MLPVALSMSLAALIFFPGIVTRTTQQIAPGSSEPAAVSAAAVTVPKLPACRYIDAATPLAGYDDWALTLLDTSFAVPSSYVPPDLVSTKSAGLNKGYLVRAVMVPDLKAMVKAAAAAGAPLAVVSAYRSYRTQSSTFWKWVRVLGAKVAPLSSARPGHSEHQLGLAIDFKARGGPIP